MDNKNKIRTARLYGVTLSPPSGRDYRNMVELACRGGTDVIQLRDKQLTAKELTAMGRQLKKICLRYGALFIVNDRLDVALACEADGVHLGQDDLPLAEARKIAAGSAPSDFLIGVSTHSLEQALKAEKEGADYVGCGPVYATPTKPDYGSVGIDLVKQYRERIRIPFAAIGGIDLQNAPQVIEAGAACVAVVRSLFASKDIENSARHFKSFFEGTTALRI